MAYYKNRQGFRLFERPGVPAWRSPQLGALGAVSAHWTLHDTEPALVSLPTGVGKTAIALSAPYLIQARRILVVVPSAELRRQMAHQFSTEDVLLRIGALEPPATPTMPRVREITGIVSNWAELEEADVVVGLPNSLSPVHYPDGPPPALFDLLIIDEAHHLPAKTWRAILDHFNTARCLLLTATPLRRDGTGSQETSCIAPHYVKRCAKHYTSRCILVFLSQQDPSRKKRLTAWSLTECCALLRQPEHATSSPLGQSTDKGASEGTGRLVPKSEVCTSRYSMQVFLSHNRRHSRYNCARVTFAALLLSGCSLRDLICRGWEFWRTTTSTSPYPQRHN